MPFEETNTILKSKIKESVTSVLPVTGIVIALSITLVPISSGIMLSFILGAMMLIIGMGLFTLGTEMAMTPMGEYIGSQVTKSRKLYMIILIAFIVGVIITISEPDLQVLAEQVPGIPNFTLLITVACGVGIFLVIAMLRSLLRIKLSHLLIAFYIGVFILAVFTDSNFLSIAFDSGGVTTGPMTVPFIMALGVGVASIRSDKTAESDSFGLVALCSIGPIISVMILGIIFKTEAAVSSYNIIDPSNTRELIMAFVKAVPKYAKEMAASIGAIAIFFLIYQQITGPLSRNILLRILIGIVYTYIGLVLFLTGVNVGFMSAGNYIGYALGEMNFVWVIIPIGMVIGYFIVEAEPAVHVLTKQVETITSGAIPEKLLLKTLSIGVAVSVGLAMLRVITGMSILWLLIPGYSVALLLTFMSPDIFTAIAFDSGGVASGPMTATFLLPFAMGVCDALGGNAAGDAFGVVAMVALTPLIAIQILGIIFKVRSGKDADILGEKEDIIEF